MLKKITKKLFGIASKSKKVSQKSVNVNKNEYSYNSNAKNDYTHELFLNELNISKNN